MSAPGRSTAPLGRQCGHDVEVDLLVVERDDATALGRAPARSLDDEGRPHHHLGGHRAGGVVGALGQHGHGEAEGAGRLAGHAGQLARPDEPDVVGLQLARPRPGIRLDRGADTLGRLREGAPGTWPKHCVSGA